MRTLNCLRPALGYLSLVIGLSTPLSGVGAPVPDECVRSEPAPVFEAKQLGIHSHRFALVSSHEAQEQLRLNSGELVDIHHGGCEYFVTTFRFSSVNILKSSKSRLDAYKISATLLRRLQQLKGKSGFDLVLAARTLEAVVEKNRAIEFGRQFAVDGDGTDFLQTQVQVDAAGQKAGVGFVQVSLFKGPL